MSSFLRKAINPETKKEVMAIFIDDYYGMHRYGVGFRKDGKNATWMDKGGEITVYKEDNVVVNK